MGNCTSYTNKGFIMNRKDVHTLLDEALDSIDKVSGEVTGAVKNAVDAVKAKVAPNKFNLGQLVKTQAGVFGPNTEETTGMITGMRLTVTNKVVYTVVNDLDETSLITSEEALSA